MSEHLEAERREGSGTPVGDEEAQALVEAVDSPEYAPSPDDGDDALPSFSQPTPPHTWNVNLNVPYIHQLWDTADNFNGRWACGPTSTAMVLAYYGVLAPQPITVTSTPQPHTSNYGWYLSNTFAQGGRTFDATARTESGARAPGLYGAIVDEPGIAYADKQVSGVSKGVVPVLRHFLAPRGNQVRVIAQPTWRDVTASLDEGHPVILSGNVFGWPHILVIRGYWYKADSDDFFWIVNDPHGYRNGGEWNGGNVVYRWWEIHQNSPTKYMYRISGPRA